MFDISEKEPSKMLGELSKELSSEVGKTERVSKHCSKIDTTRQLRRKRGVSTNLPLLRLMQRMTSKLPF